MFSLAWLHREVDVVMFRAAAVRRYKHLVEDTENVELDKTLDLLERRVRQCDGD